MNEFSSKLGGFSKYKKEMSDATLFNMMKSARPNGIRDKFGQPKPGNNSSKHPLGFEVEQEGGIGDDIRERGLNIKGYSNDTSIGQIKRDYDSVTKREPTFGGNDNTIKSLNATQKTTAQKATNLPDIQEHLDDNYKQHDNRNVQNKFSSGPNNQKAIRRTDLSRTEYNIKQKNITKDFSKAGFGNKTKQKTFYQENGSRKQLGRGLVTSELFGKVGDSN